MNEINNAMSTFTQPTGPTFSHNYTLGKAALG